MNQALTNDTTKVYGLNDQSILTENSLEILVLPEDGYYTLEKFWQAALVNWEGLSNVNLDFPNKITQYIADLVAFTGIPQSPLDKSPKSMKLLDEFFDEFYTSSWLGDDWSEAVSAYFGEVIINQYPFAYWKMEDDQNPGYYHPSIYVDDNIKFKNLSKDDFFYESSYSFEKKFSFFRDIDGHFGYVEDPIHSLHHLLSVILDEIDRFLTGKKFPWEK